MADRCSRHLRWFRAILLVALAAAACGSEAGVTSSATTITVAVAPPPPTTTTAAVATTAAPITEPPAPVNQPAAVLPSQLYRAGSAGQAVVVTADGYGATTAVLSTWNRDGDGWEPVHGPWPARVGYAGFAPPGEKREGDGRTPSGTFAFDFLFGIEPDPGGAMPYRRVTGPSIVWDDVPSSPTYNQWVDGGRGEQMYVSPVYDYGAVIAYNTARTPGLGSAIFLHVTGAGATAGCVSLPAERLLEVLRWLDPARAPVIVMGVG